MLVLPISYLLRELKACSLRVLYRQLNNRGIKALTADFEACLHTDKAKEDQWWEMFSSIQQWTSFDLILSHERVCLNTRIRGYITLNVSFTQSGWKWQSNGWCGLPSKCKGISYTKKPLQYSKQWTHNSLSSLVIGYQQHQIWQLHKACAAECKKRHCLQVSEQIGS